MLSFYSSVTLSSTVYSLGTCSSVTLSSTVYSLGFSDDLLSFYSSVTLSSTVYSLGTCSSVTLSSTAYSCGYFSIGYFDFVTFPTAYSYGSNIYPTNYFTFDIYSPTLSFIFSNQLFFLYLPSFYYSCFNYYV